MSFWNKSSKFCKAVMLLTIPAIYLVYLLLPDINSFFQPTFESQLISGACICGF